MQVMTSEQLLELKKMVEDAGDLPETAKNRLLELLAQQQAAQGQWLSSVEELEAAHPEATGFMNRLATTLANMGI